MAMESAESGSVPDLSMLHLPAGPDLDRLGEQVHALLDGQRRLQGLMGAVLRISSELELPSVLRHVVSAAMELVGARYGALGVLDERSEELAEFIPLGLTSAELDDLSGVELPRGRGLLGHLIRHPEPLRLADISRHPESAGFPPGHPPMRSLLGVAISVRDHVYGNLYLSERTDGKPFHPQDEDIIRALAGVAGIAIEHARLFQQVRTNAETFQRLLLPQLPDLRPYRAATAYRPATAPGHLGGDWYDALPQPGGACAAVIGDVVGHDTRAAAAMSRIRSMLRALCLTSAREPDAVLTQLDTILHTLGEDLFTTACLARVAPGGGAYTVSWSNAGHPPPLLLLPDGDTRYLEGEPGLPLGVDPGMVRPRHTRPVPGGSTVLMFTDGLVERPGQSLEHGLTSLARIATAQADQPLDGLCASLVDQSPSTGEDDIAILALRVPSSFA
jgi:hypothetical protein